MAKEFDKKEQMLAQEIERAYRRIFKIKEQTWETKFLKSEILTNIVERETNEGINYRIRETVNKALQKL